MTHREDATSREELSDWLETMPGGERVEIERTWNLSEMGCDPEPGADDVAAAWEELSAQMASKPGLRLIRGRSAWWVAAAVAVVLLGTAWIQFRTVTLTGLPGQDNEFTLPDGSQVELAAGSRLTFRAGLRGRTRTTRLVGEAFFDIVHSDKGFGVGTFNARVEVLGTRFNVRAWAEDPIPETLVTLEEGSVRLTPIRDPSLSIVLEPGQRGRVPGDPTAETVPLDRVTAWREGGFYFDDWSVPTILAEIERRYDTRIAYPPSLRDVRLTLYHDRPGRIDVLLEAIGAVTGSSYRGTANGYEILDSSD